MESCVEVLLVGQCGDERKPPVSVYNIDDYYLRYKYNVLIIEPRELEDPDKLTEKQ